MLPVLASSTYRSWLSRPVEVTNGTDGLVYVSYSDSITEEDEYRYAIDTAYGLVRKLQKYHTYPSGYQYTRFDGTFLYDETAGDVPVLRAIALNGDTTLQRGGYRFFDIEVNTPLDDTLFEPVSVAGHAPRRIRSHAVPVFNDRPVSFDLRGRALPPAGGRYEVSGFRMIVTGGVNRTVTSTRNRRGRR